MSRPAPKIGVQPCLGLKITRNAGISFTDALGRVHDLEKQKWLTLKDAASDPRMALLGQQDSANAAEHVGILVRRGELYPVFRRTEHRILIADCALTDWQARALQATPRRTLVEARAERVA